MHGTLHYTIVSQCTVHYIIQLYHNARYITLCNCITMHGTKNIKALYIVCIFVRQPGEDRRRDRQMSVSDKIL